MPETARAATGVAADGLLDHPAALVFAGFVFLVLCGLVTWQRLRCLKRTRRDRELLRELATGRDLLEAVFEATSDAILVLDENFRVVSANRTAAARFGCDVTVEPGGEHYFHTPEQLDALRAWTMARVIP